MNPTDDNQTPGDNILTVDPVGPTGGSTTPDPGVTPAASDVPVAPVEEKPVVETPEPMQAPDVPAETPVVPGATDTNKGVV